jgi:Bacterial SH3 domain
MFTPMGAGTKTIFTLILYTYLGSAASATTTSYYYVANTLPPDDFLALRTAPSSLSGQRIETMPNGTLLEVMEKRPDGWWLVRDVETGQRGWAVSGNRATSWILCCAPASPDSTSTTFDAGFITPSGNISCRYFEDESDQTPDPTLRCDIREHVTSQPRPAECDLEWGDAFEIGKNSNYGTAVCHGDTTFGGGLPMLRYGGVWNYRGLTCTSEPAGLTCLNANGHGFRLSKAIQQIF